MPTDAEILEIARLLRLTGREIARKRDSNATSLGMTSAQADVLTYVLEHPGCSISDVGDRSGSTHQAACTMVSRLESRGLVTTDTLPEDRRVRVLFPTDKGRELHRAFMEMGADVNSGLLDGLSPDDTEKLRGLLNRLLSNLRSRRYSLTA